MQKGMCFLVSLLAFLMMPMCALAAFDFTLDSVNSPGPFYHLKSDDTPTLQVDYWVELHGDETPPANTMRVRIALLEGGGSGNQIAEEEIGIDFGGMVPGDTWQFTYYFPLQNQSGVPYPLTEQPYYFRVTLDSTQVLDESNETNNEATSTDFDYRIFSGDLFFGLGLSHMGSATIVFDATPCIGVPYITSGSASWSHEWGSTALTLADICTTTQLNADGYSIDLRVSSAQGTASVGTMNNTVAGLAVSIYDVYLDYNGMHYSYLEITLPDEVTVRPRASGNVRVKPIGQSKLRINSRGFVRGPGFRANQEEDELYFHSYGLPFYLVTSLMMDAPASIDLDPATSLGLELPMAQPYWVHMDSWAILKQGDSRKKEGLPSNDTLYLAGTSQDAAITGDGMQAIADFQGSDFMTGMVGLHPHTHFPYGELEWNAFALEIEDGAILATEMESVRFSMPFDGACKECNTGNDPPPVDYDITLEPAYLTPDGALGGWFEMLSQSTTWGQMDPSGATPTYYRDDGGHSGVLYFPGLIALDTAVNHTVPQYLLGTRAFTATDDPGTLYHQNDAEAKAGEGYFAGITMGPGILEPAVGEGITETIDDVSLDVLFDGNTAVTSFTVTGQTKYVLRPGGLTGVFNTNFSGALQVYGYTLNLLRFAFRQHLNQFDDDTLINGYIDLPKPAQIRVAFTSLELTCTGNLSEGKVDKESPNVKGQDDDNDGLVDEGWYQALTYWNIPIRYLGMGFESPEGKQCPDGNQKLKLVTSNQVNGISKRVTLTAFWEPTGEPMAGKDKITGPAQLVMDSSFDGNPLRKGFAVQVRNGFLNRPFDQNSDGSPDWHATPVIPPSGFTGLITRTDLPLFDDPLFLTHLENDPVNVDGAVAADKYAIFPFKDFTSSDLDYDGVPDNLTPTDMNAFRNWLNCDKYDPSTCTGTSGPYESSKDPRPWVHYSWPSSEIINLDYPLNYQKAKTDKQAKFLGIKDETKLPDSSIPLLTVKSVPDYITPERTKVSFGAGADFTQLKNLHAGLTAMAVNAFFDDVLGIDLTIDLSALDDVREELNKLVIFDLTPVMKEAIDAGLKIGDASDKIDTLATHFKVLHGGAGKITSQIQNPLRAPGQKASKLLVDKKDAAGTIVADGLATTLEKMYNHANLPALVVFDPYNSAHIAAAQAAGVNLTDLRLSYGKIQSQLASLIKIIKDARPAITSAKKAIPTLQSSISSAQSGVTQAITDINTALDGMNTYFSTDQNTNPVLSGMKSAREALDKAQKELKKVKEIHDQLDKVNKWIFDNLNGQIDTASVKKVMKWVKEKVPQLIKLLQKADQYYQTAINQAQLNTLFNDSKTQMSKLDNHSQALASQLNSGVLAQTSSALVLADKGLAIMQQHLVSMQKVMGGQTKSLATTWSGLVTDGRSELDKYAGDTFSALLKLQVTPTQSELIKRARSLYDPNNPPSNKFIRWCRGLNKLIEAPLRQASGQFDFYLATVNSMVQKQIPSPKADDIRAIIRTAALNSAPAKKLNNAFTYQFDFLGDAFEDLIKLVNQTLNRLINDLVSKASKQLTDKLTSAASSIGLAGKGGLAAAKIDGYAIVSHDEVERFHLEAEFGFDSKPKPTKFHGGLDIARWRPVNGRPSDCCPPGNGLIDASIFAKDLPAKLTGGSIQIKKVLIGFILDEAIPKGAFGEIMFKGAYKSENIVLEDIGAVAGVTWGNLGDAVPVPENYLGAKCRGKFSGYKIRAAFFLGQSCGLNVLKGLDKDVQKYIGKTRSKISGFYTRASAKIPFWDVSCLFSVGVGADFGVWYFADPPPMYGGLLGGSVYGSVGCVVSAKGVLTLGGTKKDDQFQFAGTGWAAAGLGFCDPDDWVTLEKSREDSWCGTWDASFKAVYEESWDVTDKQSSGPH